jgi:hypothetical protein
MLLPSVSVWPEHAADAAAAIAAIAQETGRGLGPDGGIGLMLASVAVAF